MSLQERKTNLVNRINMIGDEQTLEMLEQTLILYTHSEGRDITDGLSEEQLRDIEKGMNEPIDKDTVSQAEFEKMLDRWRTR